MTMKLAASNLGGVVVDDASAVERMDGGEC